MLAAMQQWFAGLVVAERCVAAVARATAATHRIAQDRKVVKLARVLSIAAVLASYVVHVIGFWTGESVRSSCSGPNSDGRGVPTPGKRGAIFHFRPYLPISGEGKGLKTYTSSSQGAGSSSGLGVAVA